MRIVIDMQGAQSTTSGNRGVGRYARALVHGIIRHKGKHEVLLVLNAAFGESIDDIRREFSPCWGQMASMYGNRLARLHTSLPRTHGVGELLSSCAKHSLPA